MPGWPRLWIRIVRRASWQSKSVEHRNRRCFQLTSGIRVEVVFDVGRRWVQVVKLLRTTRSLNPLPIQKVAVVIPIEVARLERHTGEGCICEMRRENMSHSHVHEIVEAVLHVDSGADPLSRLHSSSDQPNSIQRVFLYFTSYSLPSTVLIRKR